VKLQLRTWLVLGIFLAAFVWTFLVFENLLGPFFESSRAFYEPNHAILTQKRTPTVQSPPAQTGKTLLDFCLDTKENEAKADAVKFEKCLTQLRFAATFTGISAECIRAQDCPFPIGCIPEGVTDKELRAAYTSYALSHAENTSADMLSVAIDAFEMTWPCEYEQSSDSSLRPTTDVPRQTEIFKATW
jgi:hypothetical protein